MIPTSYTKPGFAFRLVEQHGPAAIYEKTHLATGRALAFELVIIQRTVQDVILPGGRLIPKGSPRMPGSEQWGRLGWTLPTLDAARALIASRGLAGRTAEPVAEELAA